MQLTSLGLAAGLGMLTSLAGACGGLGRAGQHVLGPAEKKEDQKSRDKYRATIKQNTRLWGGKYQSLLLIATPLSQQIR